MYDRKQIKLRAKTALSASFGLVFGTIIVGGLIISAASVLAFIIVGPIAAGLAFVQLSVLRGEKIQFGDMFRGFNNFGTNCGAGVLVGIYTILWSLLFYIPGIVKSYSYAMTFYILADHPEMKANEAITASRKMMNGHKWDLFVLDLSFIWWILLGLITCGLAFIYVDPYMELSRAAFYESIKAQNNGEAQATAEAPQE
ncbi:MAG: DUF975 family protein [Clostridia bacterium]|nr:DUF975 family protein [Clostridia bacterium]